MKRPVGFKGFTIMSIGQFISMVGSAMTQFGLAIWIWKQTGNATPFSIITTAFFIPNLIFSPIAGAFVDRWPRKRSLILPDLASGIVTIITLLLYVTGKLSLPFLYISSFVSGSFNAFQWPAYSVTISSMLKKEEYGKANGLFSITESGPQVLAPILAGALLPFINLEGIMTIDIVTFVAAIGAVLWVIIPENKQIKEAHEAQSILKDSVFGFKYIYKRKALLALLSVFLLTNLFSGMWGTLLSPMILAKFNNNSVILGIVESAFGIGGILGGLLMTVWGGTKRKVISLILGIMLSAIGSLILGFAGTVVLVVASVIIIAIPGVVANASSQAIWQSIVPVEMQGRVFSARRFIAQFVGVIPMALSGPFVDFVLTKRIDSSTFLTSIFGVGKGGAIAFLASLSGILTIIVTIIALLSPLVMNVESSSSEEVKAPI